LRECPKALIPAGIGKAKDNPTGKTEIKPSILLKGNSE